MKRFASRFLSTLLVVVMLVGILPASALPVFAANADATITRAEWVGKLAKLFDFHSEDDGSLFENYFSDVDEGSPYYRDIMLAFEFGVLGNECDETHVDENSHAHEHAFNPDAPVTRDFAAHTMVYCLGLASTDPNAESRESSIAIERGWFALVSGQFLPHKAVSVSEMTVIFADATEIIAPTIIDPNFVNTHTYKEGTIEIPEEIEVSQDENGNIIILDCPEEISEGDDFVVYYSGIPKAYTALGISEDGKTTSIETVSEEPDVILTGIGQGVIDVDLSLMQPIGDAVIAIDDEELDGSEITAQGLLSGSGSKQISGRTITTASVPGLTVKLGVVTIPYSYNITKLQAYVGVKAETSISYVRSAKWSGTVQLAYIPTSVPGVNITVSATVSVEGKVSISYGTSATAGVTVSGAAVSVTRSFSPPKSSFEASVKASAGVKLSVNLSFFGILKGSFYAKAGVAANASTQSFCINVSANLFAEIGTDIKVDFPGKKWDYSYNKPFYIWTASNSPWKWSRHFASKNCTHGGSSGGATTFNPPVTTATTRTVTFNANGGSVSPKTRKVNNNAAVGTLPTPTRTNYTFDGWFTAKTGGTKITASTKITANKTFYARWKAKTTKPTITEKSYIGGKEITLSAGSAEKIYYTTNGSTPTTSSTKYSKAFKVTANTTIKTIATRSGYTNSDVASKSISVSQVKTPVIGDPVYNSTDARVSITCGTTGSTILYTTNGTAPTFDAAGKPTGATQKYSGAVPVTSKTTINAIAFCSGMVTSNRATAKTITPATPDAPTAKLYQTDEKIAVGDAATVNWSAAARAFDYVVKLYKEGNNTPVQTQNINGNLASFTLQEVGKYTIVVEANNFLTKNKEGVPSFPPVEVEAMADVNIRFVDGDNELFPTMTIKYGRPLVYPKLDPYKRGHDFIKWVDSTKWVDGDVDVEKISEGVRIYEDKIIIAQFIPKIYTVEFFDIKGNPITVKENNKDVTVQRVEFSKSAVVPPESACGISLPYAFQGWHIDPNTDSEDMDYTAVDGNMKIYATQAWANKDLPIHIVSENDVANSVSFIVEGKEYTAQPGEELKAEKFTNVFTSKDDNNSSPVLMIRYTVNVMLRSNPNNSNPPGWISVVLKTAAGRMVASHNFAIETNKPLELQLDSEESASIVEVVVVGRNGVKTGGAFSNLATARIVELSDNKLTGWSEWSTTLPPTDVAVIDGKPLVEQKTQYSYQTRVPRTSTTSKSVAGWTYVNTVPTTGAWSAWSDTKINDVNTDALKRENDSPRTVVANYTMRYFRYQDAKLPYTRWYMRNSVTPGSSGTRKSYGVYEGNATWSTSKFNGASTIANGNSSNKSLEAWGINKGGETGYLDNAGRIWFRIRTNNKIQYRYRDTTFVHHFYSAGNHVEWVDASPADNIVFPGSLQTRTVYRYKNFDYAPVGEEKLASAVMISSGDNHSLAIDSYGGLWGWGYSFGSVPTRIMGDAKFMNVSTGGFNPTSVYSLAIDEDGGLWSWGINSSGQLGNGTNINSNTPSKIAELMKFTKVSAGCFHSIAIDEHGELWGWGSNNRGQLGDGTNDNSNIPIKIMNGIKFKYVFAGNDNSFAIDEAGGLWAWGYNNGSLGDGATVNRNTPVKIMDGTKFKSVSSSKTNYFTVGHTIAIDENGGLWSWGDNQYGRLGDGTTINRNAPARIMENIKVKSASAGFYHNHVIDENGGLWAWGVNSSLNILGKIPSGSITGGVGGNVMTPIRVNVESRFTSVSVAGTGSHSHAIDENGALWAWGANDFKQLGIDSTVLSSPPIKISGNGNEIGGKQYTIKGELDSKTNFAWKKATVYVYKEINTDPNEEQRQYVGQTTILPGNKYNFTFIPRESIAFNIDGRGTGDFIVCLALEGSDKLVNIDVIKAPRPEYTVTFLNEGQSLEVNGNLSQKVREGENAIVPDVSPEKPGHIFIGWDYSPYNIMGDLSLNAQFIPIDYVVVKIDFANEDAEMKTDYRYGTEIRLPEKECEGKTFLGWYTLDGDNKNYVPKVDDEYIFEITDHTLLIADWETATYTVTFVDENENVVGEPQIIAYGEAATPPAPLISDKKIFLGWATDSVWWNVTSDLTVYPITVYSDTVEAPSYDSLVILGDNVVNHVTLKSTTPNAIIYYAFADKNDEDFEPTYLRYTEGTPIIITEDVKILAYAEYVLDDEMNPSELVELDVLFLTAEEYDCRNCGECDRCQNFCVNCDGEYAVNGCICDEDFNWICPVCGLFFDECFNKGYCPCPISGMTWDDCECEFCQLFCSICGGNFAEDECDCSDDNEWFCAVCGLCWDECPNDGKCLCPVSGIAWNECEDEYCNLFCVNCGGEFTEDGCTCNSGEYWFCSVCGEFWEDCINGGNCLCPISGKLWYDCINDCCLIYCFECGGKIAEGECECSDEYSSFDISYGDVNGDGEVNAKDVTILRRYLAGGWEDASIIDEFAADVNGDSVIDARDVTRLRRYLAGGWANDTELG